MKTPVEMDLRAHPLLNAARVVSTQGVHSLVPLLRGNEGVMLAAQHGTVFEAALRNCSPENLYELERRARAKLEQAIGQGVPGEFTGFAQWFDRDDKPTSIHGIEFGPEVRGVHVDNDDATLSSVLGDAIRTGCGFDTVLRQDSRLLGMHVLDGRHATAYGPVDVVTAPTLPKGMVLSLRKHWLVLFALSERPDGVTVSEYEGGMTHVAWYGNLVVAYPDKCLVTWVKL